MTQATHGDFVMHLTMVGTGYVGLVTGTCFADSGNNVICLDIDPAKIEKLNQGISPIYEPGLDEMIERNVEAERLHFTTDQDSAYRAAEAIFICVGTPSDALGNADLKYVLAAASDIGKALESDPKYTADSRPKIIIIKSTVPVGTNAKVAAAIAAQTSKPFRMASNPEFLKEGNAIQDFVKPDRVVIGTQDEQTGERLKHLYEPFVRQGNPIYVMDIPSAEMVKYAANAMLATKISFINEIATLCEVYDADVDQVHRGMCSDQRIGNKFLYPGLGYGGSCFPKDVLACIAMGKSAPHGTALLASVHEVNQLQRTQFIAKIIRHFGEDLSGKTFAIWGLAFKPGTDDVREAPALTIIEALLKRGATIRAYDPVAMETTQIALKNVPGAEKIVYTEADMEAVEGVDALVICTDWQQFRNPDFDDLTERMPAKLIFDGRNLYKPNLMIDLGIRYISVGRKPV